MPTNEKVYIDIEANASKLKNAMKEMRDNVKSTAWQMKELEDAGKKNTQAYRTLESQLLKSGKEIKSLGRLSRGTSSEVKRSFHQMLETAENLTTVIAGVGFAFGKMYEKGKDIVMTAARTETLGVVVQQVGKNAGYTSNEIDKFVAGVKEMGITTGSSRQSITRMIQAKLDLAKATDLARISQHAAVIADINSSELQE